MHSGTMYAIYDRARRMYCRSSASWQDELRFAEMYPTRKNAEGAIKRLKLPMSCIAVPVEFSVPPHYLQQISQEWTQPELPAANGQPDEPPAPPKPPAPPIQPKAGTQPATTRKEKAEAK